MNVELWFAKAQFGLEQRTAMYRKLSSFARQGSPIYSTIEKFITAYSAKNRGDIRAVILSEWQRRMAEGMAFSQALEGFAPESEIMLIQAGEAKGDLSGGMEKALFITNSIKRIRGAIIGGLSYPLTILLVMLGMIYMFATSVVPQMAQVLPPDQWPEGSPQTLYSLSIFVRDYGAIVGIVFVALITVSIKTLNVFRGPLREALDRFPPWSIHKTMQSSVFLITLSSLMSAGIAINPALNRIKDNSAPYLSAFITRMMEKLSLGSQTGDALDVGLFNKDLSVDIRLMGQVADFQSAIMMLGQENVERDIERIAMISKALNNIVLIFTGGSIGFIYFAFYTLTSTISKSVS